MFFHNFQLIFVKKYKLNLIAEWWFVNDIQDWLRSLTLKAEKKMSNYAMNILHNYGKSFDLLQEQLDKKYICSEVHLLIKK